MPARLRTSLAIFQVGFALESLAGFLALGWGTVDLPFHRDLILLTPAFSALGMVWLWVGRREWGELHAARVARANGAFAATVGAGVVAGAIVIAVSVLDPTSPPSWAPLAFGAAVASVLALSFVTYALVAAHLVGPVGGAAMAFGLFWALLLSALIGVALIPELAPLVQGVATRSPALGPVLEPITLLAALLAFSYLAFFLAFSDAHLRVARGRSPG